MVCMRLNTWTHGINTSQSIITQRGPPRQFYILITIRNIVGTVESMYCTVAYYVLDNIDFVSRFLFVSFFVKCET